MGDINQKRIFETTGENWPEVVDPEQYDLITIRATEATDPKVIRYYANSTNVVVVFPLSGFDRIAFLAKCLNVTISG